MISGLNKLIQQELEYTLLKPDCNSWWISKILSGSEDTSKERYGIKFYFKTLKYTKETCRCNLQESSINFSVAYEIQGRQRVFEGCEEVWEE